MKAPEGVAVKLRNAYDAVDGEPMAWKLPDLAFGSEAWALLEFEIPAVAAVGGAPVAMPITVSVQAAMRDSAPLFLMAGLPPLPVVDAAQRRALPADELVTSRMLDSPPPRRCRNCGCDRCRQLGTRAAPARRRGDALPGPRVGDRRARHDAAFGRGRDKSLAMKEASFSGLSMNRRLASRSRRSSDGRASGALVPAPEAGAGQGAAGKLTRLRAGPPFVGGGLRIRGNDGRLTL